jgi:hypothetical protein
VTIPCVHPLVGRASLIREVDALLRRGQSVLLVGPDGIGKTAVIGALERPEIVTVDPLAHVSSQRAAALRRAMDRGLVLLAAARTLDRGELGCVGRVLWRFRVVRVRPLAASSVARLVRLALGRHAEAGLPVPRNWIAHAVDAACGVPGRAQAIVDVASARWHERQQLLPPRLALVIAMQNAFIGSGTPQAGVEPGEPSS